MNEHDWLIGKEFIDAHDSGRHVVRVVGISMFKDYVFVQRSDDLSSRSWERNVHAVTPMILLHALMEATYPMVVDMIDREEHLSVEGEELRDVADVIQVLNNVKDWRECGAWKRS